MTQGDRVWARAAELLLEEDPGGWWASYEPVSGAIVLESSETFIDLPCPLEMRVVYPGSL